MVPVGWLTHDTGFHLRLVYSLSLSYLISFPFPFFVFRLLVAYKSIICAVENFSIATVYGLYYYGRGKLGLESFSMFVHYDSLAQDYLVAIQHFSLIIHEEYSSFQQSSPLFDNMTER